MRSRYGRRAASVPSVEPSSTTMTSSRGYVWARALSSVSPITRALLKLGMTTLDEGVHPGELMLASPIFPSREPGTGRGRVRLADVLSHPR